MMCGPGQLFVVTAPSGVGKSTLIGRLLERVPGLEFSVSTTTRLRREGEREGHDYNFVDRARFEAMARAGEFIEWAEVHANLYGTTRAVIEGRLARGCDVLLDIDVQGARQVRALEVPATFVFVLPPDYDTLVERLSRRRTETRDALTRRLANAAREIRACFEADYVVVNDRVDDAVGELASIVVAARAARARRRRLAEQIVATFPDAGQDDAGA
jgi:guanylate kinase